MDRLRRGHGLGADTIPGGARLWLRPTAWESARDLASREADCCGFLDLDLAGDADRVHLDVTSPAEDAPLIAWLVGLERSSTLGC